MVLGAWDTSSFWEGISGKCRGQRLGARLDYLHYRRHLCEDDALWDYQQTRSRRGSDDSREFPRLLDELNSLSLRRCFARLGPPTPSLEDVMQWAVLKMPHLCHPKALGSGEAQQMPACSSIKSSFVGHKFSKKILLTCNLLNCNCELIQW